MHFTLHSVFHCCTVHGHICANRIWEKMFFLKKSEFSEDIFLLENVPLFWISYLEKKKDWLPKLVRTIYPLCIFFLIFFSQNLHNIIWQKIKMKWKWRWQSWLKANTWAGKCHVTHEMWHVVNDIRHGIHIGWSTLFHCLYFRSVVLNILKQENI